jgi:putative salt-induced outer membrane protein YdiY
MRHYIPLLALFAGIPMLADVVVLKNGDRVTGKIVKKDGPTLTVKSDMFGDVNVKWDNVATVTAETPLTVVVAGATPLQGKVAIADGKAQVTGAAGAQEIPLEKVETLRDDAEQKKYLRYLKPPITDLWAGYFDVGFATAQGNAKTETFTTAFNATRATGRDKINFHFNQIFAQADVSGKTQDTAKAMRGGAGYNRNISSRIFVDLFNDYEHDAFQNLDLRVVAGGGLGWNVWKKERGQFNVVAGGSVDRDHYSVSLAPKGEPDIFSRHAGEFYWGNDLSYKLAARSSFKQAFRLFNNLTNTGDYRMNFDIGSETRIARWLSWQVTASDRYLTSPSPGRKKNDLLISSGIRLTFAR